jgi:hypothetical protein
MARNPAWTREELILALDLYTRIGASYSTKPEVIELSQLLNTLKLAEQRDAEAFRNPNGVAMKLGNFAALDPSHKGDGLSRGGKGDREVWEEFAGDLPKLSQAVAVILAGQQLPPSDEVAKIQALIEEQAGRKRQGQGFSQDAKARKALEDHAMEAARAYLEGLQWSVKDVSKTRPYDFLCTKDGEEIHVEVKGTSSEGKAILISPNEAAEALAGRTAILYVLANVKLAFDNEGEIIASGGDQIVLKPWKMNAASLKPLGFEYTLT